MGPRWSLIALCVLNVLNYMDRYIVAAALPLISAELALNNRQGGQLVSAFVVGYVLCSPLFGYLGDRYHRPRLMLIGVLLWSLATVGSGLGFSFLPFLLCRMAVGVGEASFGTIAPGYIRDRIHDPMAVTRALSWFAAAIPVGSALGYVLTGQVTTSFHWSYAFFFGALPGLVIAWLLLAFPEERRDTQPAAPLFVGIASIARSPFLPAAIAGYAFNSFGMNGIAAFVTKYGVEIGIAPDVISQRFVIVLVIAGFTGTLLGGRLAAKLSRESIEPAAVMLRFVAISGLIAVPFAGFAFTVTDPTLFIVLCFLAEFFVFAGVGPINAVLVLSAPSGLVTLTQGVTIFVLNLFGAFLAPMVVGWVADRSSLALGLQCTTIALLFSALLWFMGSRETTRRRSQ